MEVDEIQTPQPARKFSRVSSNGGRIDSSTNIAAAVPSSAGGTGGSAAASATSGGGELVALSANRLRQWPHSSRIIRVSRASGGKDRHSKVWTARGPRDRRVRLSVNTAIQFYDLQDRLGYEQPSKAVEWLIKAAADAINELPSLDSCATFPPETPRQLGDERRAESPDPDPGGASHPGLGQTHPHNQNQNQQLSRSGGSSNNSEENSKGSAGGLSLSRTEIRVKARERARERTAKEKERENEPPTTTTRVQGPATRHNHPQTQQQNVSSNIAPQTSSFTQLLTAGISNLNESNPAASSSSPAASSLSPDVGLFHKQARGSSTNSQWLSTPSTTAMDYFENTIHSHSHSHLHSHSLPQVMAISDNHHHQQLSHHHNHQNFAFLSDHHHQQPNLIHQVPNSTTTTSGNIYNFNFTISSSSTTSSSGLGAAGFNSRGTLQSNSPSSLLPYLQRFNSTNTTTDSGNNSPSVSVPFFLGGAAVSSAGPTQETHHHHQFHPPGLQLCYGDGPCQSDHQKGKSKNN